MKFIAAVTFIALCLLGKLAAADTFKINLPTEWKKVSHDGSDAIYKNTRSAKNETIVLQSFDALPDDAKLLRSITPSQLTHARERFLRQIGLTNYTALTTVLRKSKTGNLKTYLAIESLYRDINGQDVQMAERQYLANNTMYIITYLIDAPAINDHDRVSRILDSVWPNPSSRHAENESPAPGRFPAEEIATSVSAEPAAPLSNSKMSDAEFAAKCKGVPDDKIRKSSDSPFKAILELPQSCLMGAVVDNIWGLLKGICDVGKFGAKMLFSREYRSEVRAMIGVGVAEAGKDKKAFAKRIAGAILESAEKYIGDVIHCYSTAAQIRAVCEAIPVIVGASAGGYSLIAKIVSKAPLSLREEGILAKAIKAAFGGDPDAAEVANVQAKGYSPTTAPTIVKSSKVDRTTKDWKAVLDGMGVKTKPAATDSYLQMIEKYGFADTKILAKADGVKSYGEVLEVENLPPAKKTFWSSDALTNPEMQSYLEKVHAMGYRLVIDTSMEYTGAGAYFSPSQKMIALTPKSPWSVFLHEFQHLEFYESIGKKDYINKMVELRQGGQDLVRAMPKDDVDEMGVNKLNKIQNLIDRGITPSNAINESLSVDRELQAIGWKRYIPSSNGTRAYRYMLRHQITDLEELGDALTAKQISLIEFNKRMHALATAYDFVGKPLNVGSGALSIGIGGEIMEFMRQRYKYVYYDNHEHYVGVRPDGVSEYLSLGSQEMH